VKYKKKKNLPHKKVLTLALVSTALIIITIASLGYYSGSIIYTILLGYLPTVMALTLLISEIYHLYHDKQNAKSLIEDLKFQLYTLEHELDTLKKLSENEKVYEKRHALLKKFVNMVNKAQTPEEVIEILSSFISKNYTSIKGFSILIKSKQAMSPAPLIRKGDTSPPQIKLDIPGRENIFFVHVGYLPGHTYTHEIEDILEIFRIALKKWEDLKGSITDPLTGAYNRQFLSLIKDYLEDENSEYTLLMIDLDGFKEVNDTLGHDKGDEILKSTVKKIESSLRENDILIRYGGDEFLVVIISPSMENGLRVAERIRLSIRNNLISASIGAVYKKKGIPAPLEKLLKLADALMYIAKKEKDKVVGGKWEGTPPTKKSP